MNTPENLVCWNCGHDWSALPQPLSRHANCEKCFTELHCCKHCVFYDPQAVEQCQEDRAEPPINKEGANFCEYLKPKGGAYASVDGEKATAAKAKLAELFGNHDER